MSDLRPFRAVRPARERAAAVSSVPYDVVNTDEARRIAAGNPLSFLHVTRSEIDLPDGTDPYSAQVYDRAKKNFATLGREAPLVEEDTPSIYFYRLRMGGHEQTGVAGCFSLDEYDRDLIKKHRAARADRRRLPHLQGERRHRSLLSHRHRRRADLRLPRRRRHPPHDLEGAGEGDQSDRGRFYHGPCLIHCRRASPRRQRRPRQGRACGPRRRAGSRQFHRGGVPR
jgi:hypothetical protein